MPLGGLPHRARIGHDLLLRRSRHIVQDRPLPSVRWADIPQPSTRDRPRPAAWQQYWQQSRWNGSDPRPSAFQAGHIPSRRGSCERYARSAVAAVCRWSLLLLSPLLSAAVAGRTATCRFRPRTRIRARHLPAPAMVLVCLPPDDPSSRSGLPPLGCPGRPAYSQCRGCSGRTGDHVPGRFRDRGQLARCPGCLVWWSRRSRTAVLQREQPVVVGLRAAV
jgi:hypothetical protein